MLNVAMSLPRKREPSDVKRRWVPASAGMNLRGAGQWIVRYAVKDRRGGALGWLPTGKPAGRKRHLIAEHRTLRRWCTPLDRYSWTRGHRLAEKELDLES